MVTWLSPLPGDPPWISEMYGYMFGAVEQHGQSAPLAVPQLGSCTSSGRAGRLRAARHSQEEAGPLGAPPLPRLLEPAASKAAHSPHISPPSVRPFRSGDNCSAVGVPSQPPRCFVGEAPPSYAWDENSFPHG